VADDPGVEPPVDPARRRFLKTSGIAAAGVVIGGAAGSLITADALRAKAPDYGFSPLPALKEPGFEHVVVLMFENRSFDHMLGWLYRDEDLAPGQKFDGLHQGDYSNKAPDGTVVPAHVYTGSTDDIMTQPDPDPGEFYSHVNTQLFDVIDPPSNAEPLKHGLRPPYNAPADTRSPSMTGFVRDYIVNYEIERGETPDVEQYSKVMGGFSPDMLPVISTLARSFGVYDHWYAAVPSQTFCNRSFFHASTSHGFVTNARNGGFEKWLSAPDVPTIFNRLQDAGKSWRVYYDEEQVVSLTGMLHAPSIQKYWKTNFRGMKQFHDDARSGNLPEYAFIEPRMIFDHNDMHPPLNRPRVVTVPGQPPYDSALSDMRAGEALLAEVYTAIKAGKSTTGSNAINTALIVTFDEHGGIHDHVPPPSAVTPTGTQVEGEMDFTFDRLGCRVPTIVVSAYTRPGSVINDPMHHASVIKTLAELHGLEPLNKRDAEAPSIRNAINLKKPRQPELWPTVAKPYVPPNPERHAGAQPNEHDHSRPLTPPAMGLLGILLAKYEPKAPVPDNYADAYAMLHKHGENLFGISD
jgi:phospholipase C